MYNLINRRICDIVLVLLLVWSFIQFHCLCCSIKADIWYEIGLILVMVYYTSIIRFKRELEEDPCLQKFLLPVCKPLEWLFERSHALWLKISFLRSETINISKHQYEMTYSILSVLGNFMIISFIQITQWNSPTECLMNLLVIVLLFLIGGFISFAVLELSLRMAIKIATISKKR